MDTKSFDASDKNVRVYVRVRPPVERELKLGFRSCVSVKSDKVIEINTQPEPRPFTFDHVADIGGTQEDVFQKVGKPITDTCLAGYNGTIFAYGQTGSGKTYTIQGKDTHSASRGVVPRVFEYLCAQMERNERKSGGDLKYVCKCSFIEIYNDRIYDLLEPGAVALTIREHNKKGIHVGGLTENVVSSAADMMAMLDRGTANRRVGETAMNRESSRSHSVFTINLCSTEMKDGVTTQKFSRFNLVDLAGSERQKETNASGDRLKEASQINQSLSALGNVIMALVQQARTGKKKHVHYRDSKLTFLLKDSLGGNSLTCIIACLSPAHVNFGETLSTLKFAQRAKHIKNNAIVNEDQSHDVHKLQRENELLKTKLMQLQANQTANSRRLSLSFTSPVRGRRAGMEDSSHGRSSGCLASVSEDIEIAALTEESQSLNKLIKASMDREQAWADEVKKLNDKIQQYDQLTLSQQRTIQSNKMIIQLRDRALTKFHKWWKEQVPFDNEDAVLAEMERMREENKCWQDQVTHHPDLIAKSIQIINLEDRMIELQNLIDDEKTPGPSKRMHHAEAFELTQQLIQIKEERANLEEKVSSMSAQMQSPRKLLAAMSTPQKRRFESFELEKWKTEQKYDKKIDALNKEIEEHTLAGELLNKELNEEQMARKVLGMRVNSLEQSLKQAKASAEAAALRHESEVNRLTQRHEAELSYKTEAFEVQSKLLRDGIDSNAREISDKIAEVKEFESKYALAQQEIDNLTKDLSEVSESKRSLNTQLDEMTDGRDRALESIAALEQKLKTTHFLVQEKEDALLQLQDKLDLSIADNKLEKESFLAQKHQMRNELNEMKTESEEKSLQIQSISQKVNSLQSTIDQLEHKVDEKNQEIDQLGFDNENLQEDHDNLMEEFKYLKSQYEESTRSVSDLESKLEQRKSHEDELNQTISSLRENIVSQQHELTSMLGERDAAYQNILKEKAEISEEKSLLKGELRAVETEIKLIRERESTSNEKLLQLQRQSIEIEQQREEVKNAYRELQDKYGQQSTKLRQAEADLQDSQTQAQDQAEEIESCLTQIQELETAVDNANAQISRDADSHKLQIDELMEELRSKQTLVDSLEQEMEEGTKMFQKVTEQLELLESQHVSAMEEKDQELVSKDVRIKEQAEEFESQLSKAQTLLDDKNNQLEQVLAQLQQSQLDLESKGDEYSQLEDAHKELNQELSQTQFDNESLANRLEDITSLLREMNEQAGTNDDVRDEEAEEERQEEGDDNNQNDNNQNDNNQNGDEHKTMIQSIGAQMKTLRQQMDKMEKKYKKSEKKYGKLENKYIASQTELSALKSESQAAERQYQQEVAQLTEANQASCVHIQELKMKLEELQKSRDQLEEDLNLNQASIQALKAEFQAKEDKFEELSLSWEKCQISKDQELIDLQSKYAELQTSCTDHQNQVEQLTVQLTDSQASVAELSNQLDNLTDQSDQESSELKRRLKDQQLLLDQHRADADVQTFEAARLAAEVDQYKQKLAASMKMKQEWLEEMNRCRGEEERAFQEASALKEQLEICKEKEASLKSDLDMAKHENKKLTAQNARLIGHQNPKQKIQHHMKIKKENDQLKAEKNAVERELRRIRKAHPDLFSNTKENIEDVDEEELKAQVQTLTSEKAQLEKHLLTLTERLKEFVQVDDEDEQENGQEEEENNVLTEEKKERSVLVAVQTSNTRMTRSRARRLQAATSSSSSASLKKKSSSPASSTVGKKAMDMLERMTRKFKDNERALASKDRDLQRKEKQIVRLEKQNALQAEEQALAAASSEEVFAEIDPDQFSR